MAKALLYGRKRWDALTRYLDEGIAEIDNNIAERAIRSIAIGRKNWLFAGSKAGGERAAAIYSHRDGEAQWRRAEGLYRCCHREDRLRLDRIPVGRDHAVEIDSAKTARQQGGMTDKIDWICNTTAQLIPAQHRREPCSEIVGKQVYISGWP